MTTTADQQANNAWNQRNSDGKHSLGDEHMTDESRRVQAPPSFTETNVALPPGAIRLANPDDPTLATAIRHAHVWSVEEP